MKHRGLYAMALLAFAVCGMARAEEELRDISATPVYIDGGNTARDISIPLSSGNPVVISSAAVEAVQMSTAANAVRSAAHPFDLGIQEWRHREIVNCSTTSNLRLLWTGDYTSYISTEGIVLSSDTTGRGMGDSYVVPHQGPVWGIHSPWGTACVNCAGVCGSETYWALSEDKRKRR